MTVKIVDGKMIAEQTPVCDGPPPCGETGSGRVVVPGQATLLGFPIFQNGKPMMKVPEADAPAIIQGSPDV